MVKLSMKAHGSTFYATRISNIEKGLLKDCSINTIHLILMALGFDLTEIFKIDKNDFLKTKNLK